VPGLANRTGHLREEMKNAIVDNLQYAHEHGADRPEVTNWVWPF
jgi:xylulose-5-phosphate/fructose-6-phosphate phosphoketolase